MKIANTRLSTMAPARLTASHPMWEGSTNRTVTARAPARAATYLGGRKPLLAAKITSSTAAAM